MVDGVGAEVKDEEEEDNQCQDEKEEGSIMSDDNNYIKHIRVFTRLEYTGFELLSSSPVYGYVFIQLCLKVVNAASLHFHFLKFISINVYACTGSPFRSFEAH